MPLPCRRASEKKEEISAMNEYCESHIDHKQSMSIIWLWLRQTATILIFRYCEYRPDDHVGGLHATRSEEWSPCCIARAQVDVAAAVFGALRNFSSHLLICKVPSNHSMIIVFSI